MAGDKRKGSRKEKSRRERKRSTLYESKDEKARNKRKGRAEKSRRGAKGRRKTTGTTNLEKAAAAVLVIDGILIVVGISLLIMKPSCGSGSGDEDIFDVQTITEPSDVLILEPEDDIGAQFECGIAATTSGTKSDDESAVPWPWVVTVGQTSTYSTTGDEIHMCTGTLMSSRHVLTAAHCFADDLSFSKNYSVFIGKHDASGSHRSDVAYQVALIRIHPKADLKTTNQSLYDFAVLSLQEEVNLDERITPVCLPDTELLPPNGAACWSQDWVTSEGGQTLKQYEVKFESESACIEKFGQYHRKEVTVCAQRKAKTCNDSGAPVVCDINGRWVLYGIRSQSPGNCTEDKPITYASVAFHAPWMCCFMYGLPSCAHVRCKLSGDPDEEASHVAKVFPYDIFEDEAYKAGVPEITSSLQERIAGGTEAVAHSWPWMVSLSEYKEQLEHFCGGTLISPRHVISAASCFDNIEGYNDRGFSHKMLFAVVRIHQLRAGTVHRVAIMRKHPLASGKESQTYDFMLLTLEHQVTMDGRAIPVALPGLNVKLPTDTKLWTQGWGTGSEENKTEGSTMLHELELTAAPLQDCEDQVNGAGIGGAICANLGDGICEGDSGGPVAGYEEGRWVLYGVISWRKGCRTSQYEIFPSASAALGWFCCYMPEIPECEGQCGPGLPPDTPKTDYVSTILQTEKLAISVQAEDATKLYPEDTFFPDTECGVQSIETDEKQGRIVGGSEAVPHSWPWVVSLQAYGKKFCAGTLVTLRHVISVATCFLEDRGHLEGKLHAIIGHHNSTSKGSSYKVVHLRKHPLFDPEKAFMHDLALLTLEPEVKITENIAPVCLPSLSHQVKQGTKCWTQGWGATDSEGTQASDDLQQLMVTVGSLGTCSDQWRQVLEKEHAVCAGDETGTGSCVGDSGAPLTCKTGDKWILYGAATSSATLSCGINGRMSLFTATSFLLRWLCCFMEKIKECSSIPCGDLTKETEIPPPQAEVTDAPTLKPGVAIVDKKSIIERDNMQPTDKDEFDTSDYNKYECGYPVVQPDVAEARLVGGSDITDLLAWPWFATLVTKTGQESVDPKQFCLATIVSPKHLISAASCFDVDRGFAAGTLYAIVGAETIEFNETLDNSFRVIDIRLHPDYDSSTKYENNIAVLTTERQMQFSDNILPACLPQAVLPAAIGDQCWSLGRGPVKSPTGATDKVSKISLVIGPVQECSRQHSVLLRQEYTTCAGYRIGRGLCTNDRGGPLLCETSGIWHLHGVATDILSCGDGNMEVFDLLEPHHSWICCYMAEIPACLGRRCKYG